MYKIVAVGGENHAEHERIKGFKQDFFGRVIHLESELEKDNQVRTVYLLTEEGGKDLLVDGA